jgi:hypothetical protein
MENISWPSINSIRVLGGARAGNPVKISGFEDSNWRPHIPELDETATPTKAWSKL